MTEPTAASGREKEAEEGKVTSEQEGLQPVAVRDDNFSGQGGPLAVEGYLLTFTKKRKAIAFRFAFITRPVLPQPE